MSPERKLDPRVAQWTVQALSRLALTFGIIVGTLILIGGEERFGGRSYVGALMYPGAPESWGYVALLAGVVGIATSMLGRHIYVWWSLMLLATWSLFFAISFLHTALSDPRSSTTGIAVYAYVAVSSLILAVTHKRSERE